MTACTSGRATGDGTALELVRRRIATALQVAGVEGVIPTPLEEIGRYAGINEVLDISDFNAVQRDAHRRHRIPGVKLKRFVGAVFFPQRIVLVDTTKPESMRRWTEAHELAHKLLPWHELATYLDDDRTLSRDAKEQHEFEANAGAAHLLFQGDQFWDQGLAFKQGLAVPVALAEPFAASITATIRYYVETNPEKVALICASRYVQGRSRNVVYTDESASFAAQYGPVARLIPSRLPITADGAVGLLADAIRTACNDRTIGHGEILGDDLNGEPARFDVETFYNGFHVFVLLKPHRRRGLSLGRRLRIASTSQA